MPSFRDLLLNNTESSTRSKFSILYLPINFFPKSIDIGSRPEGKLPPILQKNASETPLISPKMIIHCST